MAYQKVDQRSRAGLAESMVYQSADSGILVDRRFPGE
jgi:hypothetical protein